MELLFILGGEYPALAEEEIRSIISLDKGKRASRFLKASFSKDKRQLAPAFKRLAFTKKVVHICFSGTKNTILKKASDFNWQKHYEGSFRVEAFLEKPPSPTKYTQKEKTTLEKAIASSVWHKVKKPKVDLKKAKSRIEIRQLGKKYVVGCVVYEQKEDFEKRKNHYLTEAHPTGMHPKLARAMVNLTGIKGKRSILFDPMCGSGGILLEAKLMGFGVKGVDIDPIMVRRCMRNLKEKNIILGDTTKVFPTASFVVCDLPYGKNTKNINEDLYKNFFLQLEKKLKKTAVLGFPHWVDYKKFLRKSKNLVLKKEFSWYIHKSLTKKIIIIQKKQKI